MKRFCITGLLFFTASFLFAQTKTDAIINSKEVQRIETVLASNEMRGRKVFTPDIDKAADFISDEFKKIGLQTLNNSKTYRQEFAMVRPKSVSVSAILDGNTADEKDIVIITCQPELKIDQTSGYEIAIISAGGKSFKTGN